MTNRRSARRWRLGAVLALLAALAAAGAPLGAAAATTPAPAPLTWSACTGSPGYQCATVEVPRSYAAPGGPQIPLAVIEHPAADPSSATPVLVMNPGGPGESGVEILPLLVSSLPTAVVDHFDVVSFDERGTGATALTCGPSSSALTSLIPAPSRPGRPLPGATTYAALAAGCSAAYPAVVPTLDTVTSARDMDRLRQALGVGRIDFYGLSYGTVLGSVYATDFPGHLGPMVLDGAVPVTEPLAAQATDEAPALAAALAHLLGTCTGSCPLAPDPAAAYAKVAAQLAAHPLPAPGSGDDVPVTVGDLGAAMLLTTSVPAFASSFFSAVASAGQGDGGPLRSMALELVNDLSGASTEPTLWATTCQDAAQRPGALAAGQLAYALARRWPSAGGEAVANTLAGCPTWPRRGQPILHLGTPVTPAMVIGTTGDPNTPYVGAGRLAAALHRAVLVTFHGWGHTWLLTDPTDTCMEDLVSSYLVDGRVPARGASCG